MSRGVWQTEQTAWRIPNGCASTTSCFIQSTGEKYLQRIPAGLEGNHPKIVQVQGSGNTGRAHDAGSRISTVKYTAEKECGKFHGMPERRKRIFKDGCPFLCTSLYPDSPEKKWKKYGRNQNQAFLFRRRL